MKHARSILDERDVRANIERIEDLLKSDDLMAISRDIAEETLAKLYEIYDEMTDDCDGEHGIS